MVYCGKPSLACHECRNRRTRCDQVHPSCSQCIRAQRVCSYRDPLTLMFRTENEKFNRQSQNKEGIVSNQREKLRDMQLNWKIDLPENETARIGMYEPSLQHSSEEEQGICFVFRNYVLEASSNLCSSSNERNGEEGMFGYLPGIFGRERENVHACLVDAVIALGLAGICNTERNVSVMKRAVGMYTSAVKGISALLPIVDEATRDEVLIAVLLLGLYETNCSSQPDSLRYWTQHTNGASSLVSLRGDAQLGTPTGRKIFAQIRTQVIKSCIQRRIPVPDFITRFSLLALPHQSPDQAAATRLSFIVTRFCALRAPLPPTSAINHVDIATIRKVVKSASEIDQQLENWSLHLPEGYQYQILETPGELLRRRDNDERPIYGEVYHVYTDIFHVSVWNSYRSIRILVLELLLTYISYLPSSYDFALYPGTEGNETLISVWRSKIAQLCEDVLASVPFHFNTHLQIQKELWTRPPPRALNGELLMWSLYTCAVAGLVSSGTESRDSSCTIMTPDGGVVEVSSERMMTSTFGDERRDSGISMQSGGGERMEVRKKRRWICARLRAVAREMGVLHAEGLAFVAGINREVDVWQVDGKSKKCSRDNYASKEHRSGMDEGIETEGWESEGVTRERTPSFEH